MPPRPEPQQSDRGFAGTLKSKWGPLPVWGWLLVVTILALGYYLWTRRQGAQQTAPMSGQPGVVVINQGDMDQSKTKPPKPPEDHDKDEDGESKGHDDDDHHRHRRHRRDHDSDTPIPQPPAPIPTLTQVGTVQPAVPQPNVGRLFPKITPATGSGGRARKRG